ncbi:hypothetical protein GLOIN_2v1792112 [Rhizophagus irregularis DAOM 181602=DAOM 197198]|uniref:Uncharacterized protein n=2 Tax=Rhizophagus irregularis TaxID=588596 RepID=A0A015L1J5_RHIIW|nr:hypothetical protein RirG_125710 [Rhizophagus irregularis DAOM 197198w]GET52333.1 hypothetical protein GLOIN_2v1792112 [Rhizophagus irregularis DAOM 181602=DAOM 197198]
MTKSKKNRINKDRTKVTDSAPKTRKFVECNCLLHCGSSKLVDPRTFRRHQEEVNRLQTIASGSQSSSKLKGTRNELYNVESSPDEKGKKRIRVVENISDDDVSDDDDDGDDGDESPDERGKRRIRAVEYSSDDDDESPLSDNEPMPERPGRQKRINKIDDMIPDDDDSDSSLTDRSLTESDDNESLTENDDEASEVSGDDDRDLSEDEVLIEQFTASDFDDYDYESDLRNLDTNIDFNDSWILLWIFKYQARFRLPDVAIDKLIKFFKIVLSDADKRRFERFPTSSYLAKKLLKIVKQEKTYVVYPDCNTLYKVSEILTQNQNVEFRCTHVEFPNHPKHSKR